MLLVQNRGVKLVILYFRGIAKYYSALQEPVKPGEAAMISLKSASLPYVQRNG
jgi:hypothetical protein